jgi:hypothetical protein
MKKIRELDENARFLENSVGNGYNTQKGEIILVIPQNTRYNGGIPQKTDGKVV